MEFKMKELEKMKNQPKRPRRNYPILISKTGETYESSDKKGIKQC